MTNHSSGRLWEGLALRFIFNFFFAKGCFLVSNKLDVGTWEKEPVGFVSEPAICKGEETSGDRGWGYTTGVQRLRGEL